MNVFHQIKSTVTARKAAESYGLTVNRYGMARCPFHNDHTPSMKLDERFHCFACGADGDVIDYTARLFDLSPGDAARKLAADFGISTDVQANTPIKNAEPPITEQFCISVLRQYLRLLWIWRLRFEPADADSPVDDRFAESLRMTAPVEQLLDALITGSPAEAQQALRFLSEERRIYRLLDYVNQEEVKYNDEFGIKASLAGEQPDQ